MAPFTGLLLLMGALSPHQVLSSSAIQATSSNSGTYLGVLFAPWTTSSKNALPPATPSGVIVTQVLPDSPADRAGLRRNDFLLRYDGEGLTSCEQLARRIQADRPGRIVKLQIQREGRPLTLEACLAVGPPLRLAGEARSAGDGLPAVSKPAGPMLSAQVEPLPDGRLQVDLQYYLEGSGRLQSHTLTGTLVELQGKVNKLALGERRLAQVLLDRLKKLDLAPAPPRP